MHHFCHTCLWNVDCMCLLPDWHIVLHPSIIASVLKASAVNPVMEVQGQVSLIATGLQFVGSDPVGQVAIVNTHAYSFLFCLLCVFIPYGSIIPLGISFVLLSDSMSVFPLQQLLSCSYPPIAEGFAYDLNFPAVVSFIGPSSFSDSNTEFNAVPDEVELLFITLLPCMEIIIMIIKMKMDMNMEKIVMLVLLGVSCYNTLITSLSCGFFRTHVNSFSASWFAIRTTEISVPIKWRMGKPMPLVYVKQSFLLPLRSGSLTSIAWYYSCVLKISLSCLMILVSAPNEFLI